jgi:hypothetical protein
LSRNRYRACVLKGIEPRFREQRPADPLGFVVSANLHRRQLNAGQRALVVETLATMRQGGDRRSDQAAIIAECNQATVAKLGKVSPRTISTAKALKRDGIPAVVDAVKRGEVPIARAAAFANTVPPLDQARLIAEHGSPADAVNATIKAKADRAAKKRPKPKPDVRAAADRASLDLHGQRAFVNQLEMLLQAFPALDALDNPGQVAEAVRQFDDDKAQTRNRLLRLAEFAKAVADCLAADEADLSPRLARMN